MPSSRGHRRTEKYGFSRAFAHHFYRFQKKSLTALRSTVNMIDHAENYKKIMGPRHFPETSFYRIIISPKNNITGRNLTESSNYRNFIMPNNIFPNRCSAERYFSESTYAERHFPESSFSRTSFSRNIICPNVVFLKLYAAERHLRGHMIFPKRHFADSSFSRNFMSSNVSWSNRHIAK